MDAADVVLVFVEGIGIRKYPVAIERIRQPTLERALEAGFNIFVGEKFRGLVVAAQLRIEPVDDGLFVLLDEAQRRAGDSLR